MSTESLPPIDWARVFSRFGGIRFYQDELDEVCKDINTERLWVVPVLASIPFDTLVAAFQSLRVRVNVGIEDPDTALQKPQREYGGDYLICVDRSFHAEKRLTAMLWSPGEHITPREWLWLDLGCLITTGRHLRGITICPDYRLHGGPIVGLDYNADMDMIMVNEYHLSDLDGSHNAMRIRAYFSRIPPVVFGG